MSRNVSRVTSLIRCVNKTIERPINIGERRRGVHRQSTLLLYIRRPGKTEGSHSCRTRFIVNVLKAKSPWYTTEPFSASSSESQTRFERLPATSADVQRIHIVDTRAPSIYRFLDKIYQLVRESIFEIPLWRDDLEKNRKQKKRNKSIGVSSLFPSTR